MSVPTVLQKILARKAEEVAERRARVNLTEVERLARSAGSERLRLSVADDGIGIPEEMRERIFERFTQGGDAVTRRYGGTGLGLAICQGMIGAHGGRISVGEGLDGRGTTLVLHLPLHPQPDLGQLEGDE